MQAHNLLRLAWRWQVKPPEAVNVTTSAADKLPKLQFAGGLVKLLVENVVRKRKAFKVTLSRVMLLQCYRLVQARNQRIIVFKS